MGMSVAATGILSTMALVPAEKTQQQLVADLLGEEISKGGRQHLEEYLAAWNELRTTIENERMLE